MWGRLLKEIFLKEINDPFVRWMLRLAVVYLVLVAIVVLASLIFSCFEYFNVIRLSSGEGNVQTGV